MNNAQPWWRQPLWPWSRLSPWQGWMFGAVLASVMFKDWLFPEGLASDEQITIAVNDFIKEGIRANFKFGARSDTP